MPQVHTYIRNEDMEKWKALPNKSEFIHTALSGVVGPSKTIGSPRPQKRVPVTLDKIPGVKTAAELECPRHHVPMSLCLDKH